MPARYAAWAAVCLLLSSALTGCNQGPPAIPVPEWRPEEFSAALIDQLDANGDGEIDGAEVGAAPGIASGGRVIDLNRNGSLSKDELEARFQFYRDMRPGLQMRTYTLKSADGRPVADADVRLEPDIFLETLLDPAKGKSGPHGTVTPVSEGVDIPGIQAGYFRVTATLADGTQLVGGLAIPPVAGRGDDTDVIVVE